MTLAELRAEERRLDDLRDAEYWRWGHMASAQASPVAMAGYATELWAVRRQIRTLRAIERIDEPEWQRRAT